MFLTYFLCCSLLCISVPRCPFRDFIFQGEQLLISLHTDAFPLLLSKSCCGKIKKLWSPYCQSPKRKLLSFSEVCKKALAKSYFPQGNFLFFLFHTSLTKDVNVVRCRTLSVGSLTSRFFTTVPFTLWQDEDLSRRTEEWAVLYLDTKLHVCSCPSVLKVRLVIPKNHSRLQLFSYFMDFTAGGLRKHELFLLLLQTASRKGALGSVLGNS